MTAVITEGAEDSSRDRCGCITSLQPAEGRFQRRRKGHPERGQPGGQIQPALRPSRYWSTPTKPSMLSTNIPSRPMNRIRRTACCQSGTVACAPSREAGPREGRARGDRARPLKDAGEPRSLKSQDVPDSAQHSTEAARHPGFANRRCTSLMERSRNPPSQ